MFIHGLTPVARFSRLVFYMVMKRIAYVLLPLAALVAATGIKPAAAGLDAGVAAYAHGDYSAALREFRRLAARGVAKAQHNLGVMYEEGRGVPQDYLAAVKWYRAAAKRGFADAQNNLGSMYARGRGVARDYRQAVRWFRKAAERGVANAQNNLGLAYRNGMGVSKDIVQAHAWFNLAAAAGSETARANRDGAAAEMTDAQIAEAQKIARDWKATFDRGRKK